MNLGNTIHNLRRDKGVRQKDFANAVGISQTYVSQIESNKQVPELKTLRKIAEYFNIPLPILIWKTLELSDVDESKRQAYQMLKPALDQFFESFMNDEC